MRDEEERMRKIGEEQEAREKEMMRIEKELKALREREEQNIRLDKERKEVVGNFYLVVIFDS